MHVRLDAGDLMLRHTGYHAENPTYEYAQTTPGEGTKNRVANYPAGWRLWNGYLGLWLILLRAGDDMMYGAASMGVNTAPLESAYSACNQNSFTSQKRTTESEWHFW